MWATDLSNPEGGSHVVDNSCNTAGSVAAGVGEQLHHGWVHPYFAHFSSHRADSRLISETMTCVNDLELLIWLGYSAIVRLRIC